MVKAPATLFPRLFKHSRRKKRTVTHAINRQSWVKDIAYSLNHNLLHEFFELWNALQSVQLNLQVDEQEDEIIWTLEASGQYSATSAYNIQFAAQVTSSFPTLIWKAWAPPRCKMFLWLLL